MFSNTLTIPACFLTIASVALVRIVTGSVVQAAAKEWTRGDQTDSVMTTWLRFPERQAETISLTSSRNFEERSHASSKTC